MMTGRKTYKYIVATVLSALALASCIKENPVHAGDPGDELTTIQAGIATRAGEIVEPSTDYVGRSKFADQDRIVFKTIRRKENPIAAFTYSDIEFVASVKVENEKESIGWSRDKEKGHTGEGGTGTPDRIYWSDASNPHIFVGYCAPQGILDWNQQDGVYYGTLGNPEAAPTDTLDFKTGGNALLCQNDVLLTYSDEIKADDAIAKLKFYHSLAQVRVIVNISEFAAGGGDDKHSVISDMILKNMPTQYRWAQTSVTTEMRSGSATRNVNLWIPNPEGVGADANKTFTFYGLAVPRSVSVEEPLEFSFTVTYPDAMDPSKTKSHTYNASIGGLSFNSGQCTTINISLNHQNEKITVGAEYDDWEFEESINEGGLQKHNIFLNSLARKTSDNVEAPGVTIIGDQLANADDATWLYLAFDEESQHTVIKDIYGNKGTYDNPFQIKDAEQLLSLAYEVSGYQRASGTITYWTPGGPNFPDDQNPAVPVERTLPAAGNFDFSGYYIALEAGLYLQPTKEATSIEWPGIGEYVGHQAAGNKPFNGRFFGGVRVIKRLKGNALFNYIGPEGHVDQLIFEDVISVSANAAFVELNEGVVCASKVGSILAKNAIFNITGNKKFKGGTDATVATTAPEAVYVGPFCACNNGVIIECYSTARFKATNADRVSNLVGLNNGLILCSFAAGTVQATKADAQIYGIMAGKGEVDFVVNVKDAEGEGTHSETMKNVGETIFCLYDRNENTHTDTTPNVTPDIPDYMKDQGTIYNVKTAQYEAVPGNYALTTAMLQSRSIVGNHITNLNTAEDDSTVLKNTLNGDLYIWLKHPEKWPAHFHHVYRQIYPSDLIIQSHIVDRYYEYHVAAYPWVY